MAGGLVNSTISFNSFEAILGNASSLDSGYVRVGSESYVFDVVFSFIVLQHDLYEVTVDLAVGYTLDAALTHNPPFSVSG